MFAFCILHLALPGIASAQKDVFFDALLPFYRSLAGVYGDEGQRLAGYLETMASALARWDAEITATERDLRAQLAGAAPQAALRIHTVLASTYLDRGRFTDARVELDAALAIDPKRALLHRLRGLALGALGRPADAADSAAAFRDAWRIDPADPQHAYFLIAHRSSRTTRAEITRAIETLRALEQGLLRGERGPAAAPFLSLAAVDDEAGGAVAFAPAAYAQAFAMVLSGDLHAGMAALRAAAAADPLAADASLRVEPAIRGIAALRQGLVGPALGQLESALTLAPKSAQVRRVLATAYWVSGDVSQAIDQLRAAVQLDPRDERSWLALGRMLDEIGQWTDAADALRQGVNALPDSGELRWQLSALSGKRQQTDEADLELMTVADRLVLLAGKGDFKGRTAALAQAHLDYDRAVALLEQRVELTPNHAGAHTALGRAYLDQGREDEGYAQLAIALWLDPAGADALGALGRLHLDAGRLQPAVAALTRAVSAAPGSAETMHALGEALTRAGRVDEGRTRLEEAARLRARAVELQRRQRTAGMLALEADVFRAAGDHDRAAGAWQEVLALEGRSAATHMRLAEVFVAATRLDQAAGQLVSAIGAGGGPETHRRLADVYLAMGRPDDAARERRLYTDQRLRELGERAGSVF